MTNAMGRTIDRALMWAAGVCRNEETAASADLDACATLPGEMSAHPPSTADFSLVAGGPAHWLQEKLGLVGPGSLRIVEARPALDRAHLGRAARSLRSAGIGHRKRGEGSLPARLRGLRPVSRGHSHADPGRGADRARNVGRGGSLRAARGSSQNRIARNTSRARTGRRMRDSTLAEVVILVLAVLSALLVLHEFPFPSRRGDRSYRTRVTRVRSPAGGTWSSARCCFNSSSGAGSGDFSSGTASSGGCRGSSCG